MVFLIASYAYREIYLQILFIWITDMIYDDVEKISHEIILTMGKNIISISQIM